MCLLDEDGRVIKGAGQGELCFVNEYVRGYITSAAPCINFANLSENGIYNSGITEKQLLKVLQYRNKENSERYNLLTSLLKTY